LKPAWASSLQDPILKNTSHTKKGAGGLAQGVGPEFKHQYCKKPQTNQKTKKSQTFSY
jgi:hypothetical protein